MKHRDELREAELLYTTGNYKNITEVSSVVFKRNPYLKHCFKDPDGFRKSVSKYFIKNKITVFKSKKDYRRLLYDIETSPDIVYSWRTGYKLSIPHDNIINERAIICICYKWEGDEKIHSLTWDNNHCDKKMLKTFIKITAEADEIIAHNGDKFDLKWIRGRCLYHRILMMPDYSSIDTYKQCRNLFNLNSNKLDYVASYLGFGNKQVVHFEMWKKVMNGDKKALKQMVTYCKKDVKLLEQVYTELIPYSKAKVHAGVSKGKDKWSCPHCGSEEVKANGINVTALGTIRRRMHCNKGCSKHYTISNKAYEERLRYISKFK